ncbi:hypothetical protein ADIS_0141 [Lunatimonas lonarensis]|uniref:Uncharacterized protein n=1 Tax=Lunatimonas lonarensis TaxID=1232681 RepID=R7ZZ55_9BACT|nr:hypothetical protein ADIS_0141 [Lunatimonas lonarensis]
MPDFLRWFFSICVDLNHLANRSSFLELCLIFTNWPFAIS